MRSIGWLCAILVGVLHMCSHALCVYWLPHGEPSGVAHRLWDGRFDDVRACCDLRLDISIAFAAVRLRHMDMRSPHTAGRRQQCVVFRIIGVWMKINKRFILAYKALCDIVVRGRWCVMLDLFILSSEQLSWFISANQALIDKHAVAGMGRPWFIILWNVSILFHNVTQWACMR